MVQKTGRKQSPRL